MDRQPGRCRARGRPVHCEALFSTTKAVKYHLNLATLLGTVPELECRRLIVTHMGEDMLAPDTLEVETAEDGKVVVV